MFCYEQCCDTMFSDCTCEKVVFLLLTRLCRICPLMSNAVIRCFQIAHVKSLFSVFHAPVQNMFCHEQRCDKRFSACTCEKIVFSVLHSPVQNMFCHEQCCETMFSDYTCCEDLVYFGGTRGCAEYVV